MPREFTKAYADRHQKRGAPRLSKKKQPVGGPTPTKRRRWGRPHSQRRN